MDSRKNEMNEAIKLIRLGLGESFKGLKAERAFELMTMVMVDKDQDLKITWDDLQTVLEAATRTEIAIHTANDKVTKDSMKMLHLSFGIAYGEMCVIYSNQMEIGD